MKKEKIFIFFILFILLFQQTFAQCGVRSQISTQIEKLSTWLQNLSLAWIALSIVFAAYRFVTSEGNPGEIAKIKKMLVFAFLGGGILLVYWTFVKTIIGC